MRAQERLTVRQIRSSKTSYVLLKISFGTQSWDMFSLLIIVATDCESIVLILSWKMLCLVRMNLAWAVDSWPKWTVLLVLFCWKLKISAWLNWTLIRYVAKILRTCLDLTCHYNDVAFFSHRTMPVWEWVTMVNSSKISTFQTLPYLHLVTILKYDSFIKIKDRVSILYWIWIEKCLNVWYDAKYKKHSLIREPS